MRHTVAFVLIMICSAPLYAQPGPRSKPPQPAPGAFEDADAAKSALVSELERKLKAGDKSAVAAFWRAVSDAGAPLVEPIADAPHHRLVTFVYRSATAKNVALFGVPPDHLPLERVDGTDVWLRSFRVRDDARFVYALGADLPPKEQDFRALMPLMRADHLSHHRLAPNMSLCVLPNAPAQPLTIAAPDLPAGQVHVHRAKSQRLGNDRDIYVYTPPGFDPKGAPYPLVVLFDGGGYLTDIPAQTILDNLIAQKRIPPTVALLIDPVDRERELGMGEAFADVVALELVPWMQQRYHATSDPRATVVGGLSLGGLEASLAAFRHPDVFGNVLSQSGSYWWFNDGDDPETLTRMYANAPRKPIRFHLEVGMFEGGRAGTPTMVDVNRHLRDVLLARGYSVDFATFDGGHHAISWRGTLGDALAGLLGKVHAAKGATRKPTADLTVQDSGQSLVAAVMRAASTGGQAALQTFEKLRADKQWVADESAINQLGYQLLYQGDDAKAAIAVFEDNAAHHPQSWNAYDSLGEAYMVAGDKTRAVATYKKSLALEPHNDNARAMLKELGAAP